MKWRALLAKRLKVPGWIFLAVMALYTELLLHIWTVETVIIGRLAAVAVFAVAFGSLLGLISSLLPPKGEKWLAVVLGALLGVLCLLEYFLNDAYKVFMPLVSVFAGAEGVATGYFTTVVSLLLKNLWRIGLVLLPVVAYAVFAKTEKSGWRQRIALVLAAVILYAAGFGIVHSVKLDVDHLSVSYSFDGAVRRFGLNMAMVLEATGGVAMGDNEVQFEIPEATTPPTEPVETTLPAETVPETEPVETTEPPVVYEPHVFDLDFAALAEAETNSNIASIHSYVATVTPAMENEYTGLFEGKNLILITAEAFTAEVIDPELTPTLYRMATEGIQFTDYYQPLWGSSTTGGEFSNLVGLVPYGGITTMMEVVQQDMFLTMGNQLQKLGYSSAAFHNNDHTYYDRHKTHTFLGYDTFFAHGNGMEELITDCWTRSDLEMVDVTLPDYLDQQPFSLYYMTVSGHSVYASSNDMAQKNFDKVEHLPYSNTVKYYLAANLELEYAMESMLRQLEEAGIADDTVIVLATDHYPYGLAPSTTWADGKDYLAELFGGSWAKDTVRDHNALIIWSGCLEDMDIVVDDPVYSLDILPTLSNLFGLEYDSRLMVGRDVFSDTEPFVFWSLSGTWKTDKGTYDGSTGVFTPAEGVEVEDGYVEETTAMMRNKATYCKGVQYYDYFNVISELMGLTPDGEAVE